MDKEEHEEKSSVALDTCGIFPGGSQHAWVLVQEPEWQLLEVTVFCLSFWTCAALDLRPSSVHFCLGQLCTGANSWAKRILWMVLLYLSSRPSPVLTCLWMSDQKNPPPALDRAAPREVSCMSLALEAQGFTPTQHTGTPRCAAHS